MTKKGTEKVPKMAQTLKKKNILPFFEKHHQMPRGHKEKTTECSVCTFFGKNTLFQRFFF